MSDVGAPEPTEPHEVGPPAPRSLTGRRLLIGAGALAVAAGAVGFAAGRTTRSSHASAAPLTTAPTTALPTTALSTTTTSPESTTTSLVSTSVPAGSAAAFVGQWTQHSTLLTVDTSGYGILEWRTYTTCGHDPPPCDIFSGNNIIDGGHATFSLAASGPTVASGEVLTTTVPDKIPLGRFTTRLDPVRDVLSLPLPLFANLPLCGAKAAALPVAQQNAAGINCGA